jgi:hypothetical protein
VNFTVNDLVCPGAIASDDGVTTTPTPAMPVTAAL